MKKGLVVLLVFAVGFLGFSCANTGYNTQKGAAIGAAAGALTGQIIGRSTAGTLIGLAGGALAGAIAGSAVDQDQTNRRLDSMERAPRPYASPGAVQEGPPGQWVEIPGQWVGGKWVPAHRAWVPVNP
jgi:hypothetical protein